MSKYYNKYDRAMDKVIPAEEVIIKAAVTAEDSVEETEIIEEIPVELKDKVGVVVDCDNLRVRKHPAIVADILCVIPKGSAVVITGDRHAEFYQVCTEAGVQGYCMKKYIKVQ